MQSSTSYQKPPTHLSYTESTRLSDDRAKTSPRSMYSSNTQGKKIEESRNISINALEPEETREKPKYPIKIPVEQMKPKKSQSAKPKKQELTNRPATAKPQKSTTKEEDYSNAKKDSLSSRKRKGSVSKGEYASEDLYTQESNKEKERVARPQSAKTKKPLTRPLSSRGPKTATVNKKRGNLSIDKGRSGDNGLSQVYVDELHDMDEQKKSFEQRARELMEQNLQKYREEVMKQEEVIRQKNQEKEMRRAQAVEKAKEVLARAQKNQNKTKSPCKRRGELEHEHKKEDRKEHARKVEKKELERDLGRRKDDLEATYGMDDHTVKKRKQKVKNEWDEENNKEKYNIKRKEKAPEEKERLKRLVHEQFEKKQKEQMEQKALAAQEKEKKKQRLDALKRNVGEIHSKELAHRHHEQVVDFKETLAKPEVSRKERKPLQALDENAVRQQEEHENFVSEKEQEIYGEQEREEDDNENKEEHDDREDYEDMEEDREEREEFERLEQEVGSKEDVGESVENERDYESIERDENIYTLEPLGEITVSNNNTATKKPVVQREKEKENAYVEENANKKLDFDDEIREYEDDMEKENINVNKQKYRRDEGLEKKSEKKKYPSYFEENLKKDRKQEIMKGRDEEEDLNRGEGEEDLDFDDMLFNMSSEELMKLPYFSLAK